MKGSTQSHEWFYAVMGEKRIFEHFFRPGNLFLLAQDQGIP